MVVGNIVATNRQPNTNNQQPTTIHYIFLFIDILFLNQQQTKICLEDNTERSESNPGRSLGTYRQKGSICLEDSTFQHSEKEATDKNKAQKVMLCKSIAFTLQ